MLNNQQSYYTLQVPLGIVPESETSYEGMIAILEELHKYVPSKLIEVKEPIPGFDIKEEKTFIPTLIGGDCWRLCGWSSTYPLSNNTKLVGTSSPCVTMPC